MRRGRGLHHCIEAKWVCEIGPWPHKEGKGRCGMSRRGRDGRMGGPPQDCDGVQRGIVWEMDITMARLVLSEHLPAGVLDTTARCPL